MEFFDEIKSKKSNQNHKQCNEPATTLDDYKSLDECLFVRWSVGNASKLEHAINAFWQQPQNGFLNDYKYNKNGDDDAKNDNDDDRLIHLSVCVRPWRRWSRPLSRWAVIIVVVTAVMLFDLLSLIIFFLPLFNFATNEFRLFPVLFLLS